MRTVFILTFILAMGLVDIRAVSAQTQMPPITPPVVPQTPASSPDAFPVTPGATGIPQAAMGTMSNPQRAPGGAPQSLPPTTVPLHLVAGQHLSLTDAIRIAQARSYLAAGATARTFSANIRLRREGIYGNPLLELTQHVGDNTGGLDEDALLSATLELGDKQRQRIHAARSERDSLLADARGTANDIAFNIQSAYYEALRADTEQKQAQESLVNAQRFAQAANDQLQAGDVPRSNVIRSRVELARQTQALSAANTERANRFDVLASQLGGTDRSGFLLADELAYKPETFSLDDLLARAARNRPDIASARLTRDAREAALHGTKVAATPDLLLEARKRRLDLDSRGQSLRIGLLFPLYDLGRNRADVQAAQSALTEQEAAVNETIRTALLEVRSAYRNWEQARLTVISFQNGRLDNAKELLTMAQTGYQQGANTYLELLDAQNVYRSEQVEYVRALAAYNIARAALQRAVGGTLP